MGDSGSSSCLNRESRGYGSPPEPVIGPAIAGPVGGDDESRIPPLPAQRRQPDARRIESAVDREHLARDIARPPAAQEIHRLRQFLFQPVTVERYSVVI